MKRLIAAILTVVLVLTMAACAGTPGDNIPIKPATSSQPEETKPDVTVPDTSIEPTGDTTEPIEQPTENPIIPTEPSHEHSYTAAVINPTCTKVGYTTYTCACGDSYIGNQVNPTGHSYGAWITVQEPTTSAMGKAQRKCAACSAIEEHPLDKIIENHTHSYTGSVTQQPTCTDQGIKTFTCSCGGSYTQSIGATGHDYTSSVTKSATCTAAGVKTHTCSNCKNSYTEPIAKLAHNYTSKVTAPTCTEQGYTTYTCSVCSNRYIDNITPKKGHDWKNATCTAPKTCNNCGAADGNPTGHSYGAWVTVQEPTTSATGKAQRKCSACSATEEKILDKITENHIWQTVKGYAATCTKNGLTDGVICSICDAVQTPQQIIPATGHSWWNATCSAPRKCKYCRITDGLPAEHQFTKTVNLGEAAMKYYVENVSLEFVDYEGYTDWLAEECAKCGYLDIDSRRPAHPPMEEADIMLGKINYLREHVYGTDTWNMELDAKLVELAQIRVKELYNNFSHTHETYTNASENILYNVITLDKQHTSWKNSPDDYANMINKAYDYFGYARCEVYGKIYAVQLFWSSAERDAYYTVTEEG
ncbi:MAG: hypothetical protein IJ351_01555 [Oscillospiraceae bacterium]|nr:hypothetical protein [Oscillospiraceae bacterium]